MQKFFWFNGRQRKKIPLAKIKETLNGIRSEMLALFPKCPNEKKDNNTCMGKIECKDGAKIEKNCNECELLCSECLACYRKKIANEMQTVC